MLTLAQDERTRKEKKQYVVAFFWTAYLADSTNVVSLVVSHSHRSTFDFMNPERIKSTAIFTTYLSQVKVDMNILRTVVYYWILLVSVSFLGKFSATDLLPKYCFYELRS